MQTIYIFDIDGYNGVYCITSSGEVINKITNKKLKPYIGRSGYLMATPFKKPAKNKGLKNYLTNQNESVKIVV